MKEEHKLDKHNRVEKTKPKKGKYWCYGCDRALVSQGQKCPVCGQRSIGKHSKIRS
jgi:rRNA maturation endonuclease Nob1